MVQPILQLLDTGAGGAAHCNPLYGKAEFTSTNVRTPIPVAGTFRNWRAIGRQFLGGGQTRQLHFQKNGVTAMSTAVFTGSNVVGSNFADSVAVAAGDGVQYSRTDINGGSSDLDIDCSWDWEPDDGESQIYGWISTSLPQATAATMYVGLLGDTFRNNTETSESSLIGIAGTITAHVVRCNLAPGSGKSKSYTIVKNGVVQDGTGGTPNTTITIADSAVQNSATFTLTVVAGDVLSVKVTAVAGVTADVASAGTIAFVPTTDGQFHYGGVSEGLGGGPYTQYFLPIAAETPISSTEATNSIDGPHTAITLGGMYVALTQAPAGSNSRAFTLRVNNQDIAGTTVTLSGTDTVGSVSFSTPVVIADTDEWSLKEVATGVISAGGVAKWAFFSVAESSQRFFATGLGHTISGSDNSAFGRTGTVQANNSEVHGEGGTVTGNRSVLFNQDGGAYTLSDDDTVEIRGTLKVNGSSVSGGSSSPTTTKGDLIVRSSSADDRLPVGTNGQVLVADSAETLGVKWTTLSASGAWSLIASWTHSVDVANVDFTGLSGYSAIMVIARLLTASASGIRVVNVSIDNGSSFYNSSGDYQAVAASGAETAQGDMIFHDVSATTARSGALIIHGFNQSGCPKAAIGQLARVTLFVASTNALNAIRVRNSAGNLTGGSIYVFGM